MKLCYSPDLQFTKNKQLTLIQNVLEEIRM